MSVSEADRRLAYNKLVELAGEREADIMMQEFSNRNLADEVAALRVDLDRRFAGIDAQFAAVDVKFADVDVKFAGVDTRLAEMQAALQASIVKQTWAMVTAIVSTAIFVVAALALIT